MVKVCIWDKHQSGNYTSRHCSGNLMLRRVGVLGRGGVGVPGRGGWSILEGGITWERGEGLCLGGVGAPGRGGVEHLAERDWII